MTGMRLLREYLREAIGSVDPWASGKDRGGNLYSTGPYVQAAPVRRRGGNVLDDEADEEQETMQNTRQAACCLVLRDDGKVLAVSRKDDASQFGLPGGKLDDMEDAETAAARELEEETGLTAVKLTPVFVRCEDDGFVSTTFACAVSGEIHTDEAGVIRWVHPRVLADPRSSPFAAYNRALFAKLGIDCG